MIENILSESHGTSLFGLDDIITNLYNDVRTILKHQQISNEKVKSNIINKFNFNNNIIKFYTDVYSIKINLIDYFNIDLKNNYKLTINIFDIIDDKFLDDCEAYKDILEFYDGYTNIDNYEIVLNLNSYKCKINPKPFFIICTHELQHLYTKIYHKNINNFDYFNVLSDYIQNRIKNSEYFTNDEKDVLINLFYALFNKNEISSYSSQVYGELISSLKNDKNKKRSYKDILNDTDAYKLLNIFNFCIDEYKKISEKRIFKICEYIYDYNNFKYINNSFSQKVNKFFNTKDKIGFKKYILNLFNNNFINYSSIVKKIADNYSLSEKLYENSDYYVPRKTSRKLILNMKDKIKKYTDF